MEAWEKPRTRGVKVGHKGPGGVGPGGLGPGGVGPGGVGPGSDILGAHQDTPFDKTCAVKIHIENVPLKGWIFRLRHGGV